MDVKNAVIIQARVGSTRLPEKVLMDLCGKTVLERVVERIAQAKKVDEIIIATTENKADDRIVETANRCGVKCFRGSEEDVLARYYYAAKKYEVDHVIRITSDCPLVDPYVIDEVIECYEKGQYDIITNVPNEWEKMSYPRGLDLEIFPFHWLEKAFLEAASKYDREHVSPYIYDHAENRFYYKYNKDYSRYRWTLDTEKDWELIQLIYQKLFHGKQDFYFMDIVRLMQEHPEYAKINEDVEQILGDPEKTEAVK